ncbi:MAG: phenylalanine--tRNA ligase subunit beta [Candidatus Heimdallarchaeota archaeon]|nr:phenylalanine--tRNA ligase subunit beta [Candidatus Heimdallarchaeota archaeon]MCK5047921.1 phenylalanine--tRNA ligase subunit beta [Candidatus Heimdallarchaeota archaeon]
MVSYKISYIDVLASLKLDSDTSIDELDHLFSFAKCEIEDHDLSDDVIKIDCKTSNRPDVWSVEGLTREVKGILGLENGLADISAEPSGYIIEVDSNISEVRPFIAASVVKGLKFDDFLIKQIMQLQEKVDLSYGRRRKRSSIGVYNINMIESPIYYGLTPRTDTFVPLGYTKEMSLDSILKEHEKGQEYAYTLPTKGPLPILKGANGVVLSLPPVINSNDVGRVSEETTDVLVEVTGTNWEVVQVVTAVVTQALRDRGGKVSTVEIVYPEDYETVSSSVITPRTTPYEMEILVDDIEGYLNLGLTAEEIIDLLRKRRFEASIIDKKAGKILVQYPPYRVDILHWADIAEDIVIAFDYTKIEPTEWSVVTTGNLSPRTVSENYVRDILAGCALQEVLNFTLVNPEKLTTLMGKDEESISDLVQIANPVSINYSVLRNRLLPMLLDFLAHNTHFEYPQQLFEVGEAVVMEDGKLKNITKAAVILSGTEVSFEQVHSILETLTTRTSLSYELEETVAKEFIEGRTAKIIIAGKEVGMIGEINPAILEKWQIDMPTAALEVDLSLFATLDLSAMVTYE